MIRTLALATLLLTACSSGSPGNSSSNGDANEVTQVDGSDGSAANDTGADGILGTPDSTSDSTADEGVTPDPPPDSTPDLTPDLPSVPDVLSDADEGGEPVDSAGAPETSDGPWPNNPDKDQIQDPGWDSTPGVGTIMPNFTAVD